MPYKIIKLSFFLSSFFLFNNLLYAQQSDIIKLRIKEIKNWYAEIQSIGLKNCRTKSYIEYSYSPYPEKKPFTQNVSICNINNLYAVKKGNFYGDHWGRTILVYYKNGKIFFVFETGGGEGQLYETRYYCDSEEKIIQELHRESEEYAELKEPQSEIKERIQKNIHQIIDLKPFKILEK